MSDNPRTFHIQVPDDNSIRTYVFTSSMQAGYHLDHLKETPEDWPVKHFDYKAPPGIYKVNEQHYPKGLFAFPAHTAYYRVFTETQVHPTIGTSYVGWVIDDLKGKIKCL